jgi:extradiol dioxygenase family protein
VVFSDPCYLNPTRMVPSSPFHLSIFVNDIESSRAFYGKLLGCFEANTQHDYADFAFFGNQLSVHASPERVRSAAKFGLDGNHFGAVLESEEFDALVVKLRAAGTPFLTEPVIERVGSPKERRRMVFTDPSGNAIEVKTYVDEARIFG